MFESVTRLKPVPDGLNMHTRLRFTGGTLLEALNQLIVEQGRIAWEVGRSGVGHSTVMLYRLDELFTFALTPGDLTVEARGLSGCAPATARDLTRAVLVVNR